MRSSAHRIRTCPAGRIRCQRPRAATDRLYELSQQPGHDPHRQRRPVRRPGLLHGAGDVASVAGLAPTVTLADITDGTSSTVIWGEMIRSKNGATSPCPNQVYLMSLSPP